MGQASKHLNPAPANWNTGALDLALRKVILGQDEAIERIVNIYQMNPVVVSSSGRPIGNFLFLGPTGSGNTRLVEASADSLFDYPRAVIKIDCAEFQHMDEIASPPVYLSRSETHPLLSREVLNHYHTDRVKISFLPFDEIENGSDALWNLLTGILDSAKPDRHDNRTLAIWRAATFIAVNPGHLLHKCAGKAESGPSGDSGQTERPSGIVGASLDAGANETRVKATREKFAPVLMNSVLQMMSSHLAGRGGPR